MTTPTERDNFEATIKDKTKWGILSDGVGGYHNAYTEAAWIGWQGRAALASPVQAGVLGYVNLDMWLSKRYEAQDCFSHRQLEGMVPVYVSAQPALASPQPATVVAQQTKTLHQLLAALDTAGPGPWAGYENGDGEEYGRALDAAILQARAVLASTAQKGGA